MGHRSGVHAESDGALVTLDPAQRLVIQPISVVPSPASSGTDFHIDSEQTAWFNTVEQAVPFKLVVYPNGQDKTRQNAEIILVTAVSVSTRPGTITVAEVQKGSGLGATGTAVITTVTPGGGGVNEVQSLTVDATDGSYTLSFGAQTTIDLTPDLPAAVVQAELETLSSIGSGNITATGPVGGPYTLTFVGALANTNVAQITSDTTLLASQGMNEIQHFAVDGDAGTFRLSADGGANWTAAQAWNVSAATLQTALTGLAAIGANNCLVTFDSTTGIYTVTFVGGKACTDMVLLVADVSSLTKATTRITASTRAQDGSPARTIQTGDLAEMALVSPGVDRIMSVTTISSQPAATPIDLLDGAIVISAGALATKFVRITASGEIDNTTGANRDIPKIDLLLGGITLLGNGLLAGGGVLGTGGERSPWKIEAYLFLLNDGSAADSATIQATLDYEIYRQVLGVQDAHVDFSTGDGGTFTLAGGGAGAVQYVKAFGTSPGVTGIDTTVDATLALNCQCPVNSASYVVTCRMAILELL